VPANLIRCLNYAIERHDLQSAISHAPVTMPLTGVCNRHMVQRSPDPSACAARCVPNQTLAVLFIDLDQLPARSMNPGNGAGDINHTGSW